MKPFWLSGMDLVGLGVTGTSVLICLGGAAYANILGKFTAKEKQPVNWKEVGKTFAIATVLGIPIVATEVAGLKGVSEESQLAVIFALLNQVAGFDFGIKRLAKIIGGKPK
jgi:hypothetical protein